MYYHLHRFYQNHKRYVRSRSDAQLAGKTRDPSIKCQPEQYVGEGQSRPINPCGLIAWSLFNDSFAATVAGASGPSRTLPLDVRARPHSARSLTLMQVAMYTRGAQGQPDVVDGKLLRGFPGPI